MIDVKKAVGISLKYIQELFADEAITDVTLEEVALSEDSKRWFVTVGFTRELETPLGSKTTGPFDFLPVPTSVSTAARVYKIVELDADSGEPIAVRIREL
jgi:hypothetical protein